MGFSLGRAIAGAGAALGGYADGVEMKRRRDADEEDRKMRREEQELRLRAAKRDEENQLALADAVRPAVVEPNITNDDDGNPSSAPMLRMVGPGAVRNFNDRGAAEAAAQATNDPVAQDKRITLAMARANPLAAKQYEGAVRQAKLHDMELSDRTFRRDLGIAMQHGPEGLVDLANRAEYGPFAGRKLSVSRADGKVTYNLLGPDGAPKPILTTPDTPEGHIQAAYMMDQTVAPRDRIELGVKVQKETREGRLADAHADYYRKAGDALTVRADAAATTADARATGAGGTPKPYKMDEDDKLRFQESGKRLQSAEKLVAESLKDGAPADPTKNPAYGYAQSQVKAARLDHFKLQVELGQVQPDALAEQIMVNAKSDKDVLASLKQLADTVGTKFADRVASNVMNNDTWKAMTQAKPPAAAPRPAPATPPIARAPANPGVPPASPVEQMATDAEMALRAARQKLMSYGLAQRQKDPQGYAAAQQAVTTAQRRYDEADAAYRASVSGSQRPAFATARP